MFLSIIFNISGVVIVIRGRNVESNYDSFVGEIKNTSCPPEDLTWTKANYRPRRCFAREKRRNEKKVMQNVSGWLGKNK